jgi:hypothetical protein
VVAVRRVDGGNFSWVRTDERTPASRRVAYPIRIEVDTHFVRSNFAQERPHTAIFELVDGARLVLEECNLVNVTVPDGAEILGGNLVHLERVAVEDPERPLRHLLHECDKCAAAHRELVEVLLEDRDGDRGAALKDEKGRVLHHIAKERFRARREDVLVASEDLAQLRAGNEVALEAAGGLKKEG